MSHHKDPAPVDAAREALDTFLRAVIAEDPRAITKYPGAWSARRRDDNRIAVTLAADGRTYLGVGSTLEVAVRDAVLSVPAARARLIELEACP